MEKATIVIEAEPCSFAEAERLRVMFLTLIASGALNIRGGEAIIHFDRDGTMNAIETHSFRWRRTSEKYEKAVRNDRQTNIGVSS